MKLFVTYQKLKNKSKQLLSQGIIDEYLETLEMLTKIEKKMVHLQYLN